MAKIREQVFTVIPTGVGRTDYSQDIQQSVEPITRSWQEGYHECRTFLGVLAGDFHREVIYPQSQFVVIPYDFYLSSYPAVNCELSTELFSALGNWVEFIHAAGNGLIEVRLSKGFPVSTWRVTAFNLDLVPADFFFSAHGITTSETQYYGRGIPGTGLIPPP